MELRHLRYFVVTCEAGTVSRAAELLHITQPSLSRQLRQLEDELGAGLFDRAGRRMTPSRVGRALLGSARDVLARADALKTAATFHAHGRIDRLTVGAPTVTLTDVVAPFIATLAPEDPTIDVLGADGLSAVDTLARGADLAIATAAPRAPYRSRRLAVLPVWAYVPARHPWCDREAVALEEVLAETVIILPPAFTARQALDAALLAAGTTYARVIEAANGTVAQAHAAAGRGVALVSDDPRFGLVPLRVHAGQRQLEITLFAAWDSRHEAATTLEAFARRLGGFVAARYG
ncbi:LysR family transcriptional regulator [Amycolatopsis viridis]|uniref:DNA-binding transcriptional LysR family regulator n=1 Tax=Amycolatopsis viridis TaxID=185678 RepID=A0ABX0SX55_9PSEU|nr:LysR family transcriptional regulator [Amycolatopsis viridis]NIH80125.1 DNA-binding transcriptional LysR family regulator [Amycolatopsis viridis]